jgi:hypothetical protein
VQTGLTLIQIKSTARSCVLDQPVAGTCEPAANREPKGIRAACDALRVGGARFGIGAGVDAAQVVGLARKVATPAPAICSNG